MNTAVHRNALLVGATGLVGSHLLNKLIEHGDYGNIATLGRQAPGHIHERVTHHVADISGDRAQYTLPGADVLFCCLGTTIKTAGSQSAFRAIDFGLVVRIARAALANGTRTIVVVSSVGADPGSGNFYLRTKGEMERAVSELGFERVGVVRPSLLLGARDELRVAERLGQSAARLINPLLAGGLARYRAVDAATVAAAMIGFDRSASTGVSVIEGREIQRLAHA